MCLTILCQMKARIETGLDLAGLVSVTRGPRDAEGGYTWQITFLSTPGDVPQLTATSQLAAIGRNIVTGTIRDGNTIGGNFTLGFLGEVTRPIPVDASADDVETILLEDFSGLLANAQVVRSAPLGMLA